MDSPAPPATSDRRAALTAVALVALGLAAALVIRWGGGAGPTSAAANLGDPVLGDPGAPVEIVEYSDFGCPYCARHAREVQPRLVEEYVETGVARYVWRDLPLQGDASERAALAARAAQEQDRFWEFHDALFAGDAGLGTDQLRQVAEEAGLDVAAFDESLRAQAHQGVVEAGREQAERLGLTGTPSFTVNGERVLGAQPYEVFAEVIERAAEEAAEAG